MRALTDDEIKTLHGAATAAGLDALVEIHSEPELARALAHQARIIGVNNRDLAIFKTDLALSEAVTLQGGASAASPTPLSNRGVRSGPKTREKLTTMRVSGLFESAKSKTKKQAKQGGADRGQI